MTFLAAGTVEQSIRAGDRHFGRTLVLSNGATVRPGAAAFDPATGLPPWAPPRSAAGRGWLPVSRAVSGAVVVAAAATIAWMALLVVPAVGLLGGWTWARRAMWAWVAGRVALEAAGLLLVLLMTRQLDAEFAARHLRFGRAGPAQMLNATAARSGVALLVTAGIAGVLLLPAVRRWHARAGLRPSIPHHWRPGEAWGRRLALGLAVAAGGLVAAHAAAVALAVGDGSAGVGLASLAGVGVAVGLMAWAVARLRRPTGPRERCDRRCPSGGSGGRWARNWRESRRWRGCSWTPPASRPTRPPRRAGGGRPLRPALAAGRRGDGVQRPEGPGAAGGPAAGGLGVHPAQPHAETLEAFGPRALQAPQRDRAVLPAGQGVPAGGDAAREKGRELPRLRPARRGRDIGNLNVRTT